MATVFEDWLKDLKVISKLFGEYALISGLELNWKKVVVVPLDLADVETWRNEAAAQNAQWAAAQYGRSAKYLGFILGPGRDEKSWTGPLDKLQSRAKEWGQIGGGLLLTTLAYAVYMLPVLTFVGQLMPIPTNWEQIEQKVVNSLAPGPRDWCPTLVARNLRALGMPKEFEELRI